MTPEKFKALLYLISATTIRKISDRNHWSDEVAMNRFFSSAVYRALEKEETKVWQYSADMLVQLFEDERSGNLIWPEV